MALILKENYRVGMDHNETKSTAFITDSRNKPVESFDIRMISNIVNKIKHYNLIVTHNSHDLDRSGKLHTTLMHSEILSLSIGEIELTLRADIIGFQIAKFLKEFQDKRHIMFKRIALEYYSRAQRGDKFKIAEATGILKLHLSHQGFKDIFLISPASLKKYIADFGHADKVQIERIMKENLGFSFINDDLNDAYLLSIFEKDESDVKTNKKRKTQRAGFKVS